MSKLSEAKHHISVQVDMDELDLTSAESKATYEEIQEWVQEKYGFHVTNLNIAQVKQKHGIIEREIIISRNLQTEYDLLIMDECSMVSNADMNAILSKTKCKMMILVGDTYQIEAINFGNWFSFARYFIPKATWWELENPYRTKDEGLLELWRKVRLLEPDLTEHIVSHRYSSNLNSTVFDKRTEDEIILCLNYDGLYGINNSNFPYL